MRHLGIGYGLSIGLQSRRASGGSLPAPIVEMASIKSVVVQNDLYHIAPGIITLSDGSWYSIYYENTQHSGSTAARTKAKISTDKGKMWSDPIDLFPPGYNISRYDSYICNPDGRIYLLLGDYSTANGLMIHAHYSDDDCKTWSDEINITSTYLDSNPFSHGSIVVTSGGRWLMPIWGTHTGDGYKTVEIIYSDDRGLTWADLAWIDNPDKNTYDQENVGFPSWTSEPALIYAPNGDLLLFTRGNGRLLRSTDDGATWDEPGTQMGLDLGSPQFCVDGDDIWLMGRKRKLLTTYSAQDIYDNTLIGIKSSDNFATHNDPIVIDRYGGYFEGDGGYCCPLVHDNKISVLFATNEGMDSALGINSEYQPYIAIIDDIKYDSNFGDETRVNVRITFSNEGMSSFQVYGKEEGGEYALLGSSYTTEFNHLATAKKTWYYKCKPDNGDYSEETSLYVYHARVAKLTENFDNVSESPDANMKLALETLISSLQTDNLFSTQFDQIIISKLHGLKSSKMNLVQNGFYAIGYDNGGALTFTPFIGYNSDGTNSYLRNFRDDIGKLFRTRTYPADDAFWGILLSGTITSDGNQGHGLKRDTAGTLRYTGLFSESTTHYIGLNSSTKTTTTQQRVSGYNGASRSVTGEVNQYYDGNTIQSSPNNSVAQLSQYFFLCAVNDGSNSPVYFTATGEIVSGSFIGASLSQANFSILQTQINTFLASLYPTVVLTTKSQITITVEAALDEASTTTVNDFVCIYDGDAVALSNLAISSSTVTMDIDVTPQFGKTFELQYTGTSLLYNAGGAVTAFTRNIAVTHLITAPPTILSADIGYTDEYTITLTLDQDIAEVYPDLSAFSLTGHTWASILRTAANTLELVSNEAFTASDVQNHRTHQLSYIKPISNPLQGTNDNYIESFDITAICRHVTDSDSRMWWDCSDSNTITIDVNNRVSLISDKMGVNDLTGAGHTRLYRSDLGCVSLNGADDYFVKTFTLNQPTTIYFVGRFINWANNKVIFDGVTANTGKVLQKDTYPGIAAYAGSAFSNNDNNASENKFIVISVQFNAASSMLRINKNTRITGNFGSANMGGVNIGRLGGISTAAYYSQLELCEMIITPAGDSEAVQDAIIDNLISKWEIT